MDITLQSQIYISGWAEWARVLEEKNGQVFLSFSDRSPEWHSKRKIENLMKAEEPSFCEE